MQTRPRLKTLKPRLSAPAPSRLASNTVASRRVTGRALQARRLQAWNQNPTCAVCGRLVEYPYGFELDHIVALYLGGADVAANCQLLCVWFDHDGRKQGCHADKTRSDAAG